MFGWGMVLATRFGPGTPSLLLFSCTLLPGHHEVSSFSLPCLPPSCPASEPEDHWLKPLKLWDKIVFSFFKLQVFGILSQQQESRLIQQTGIRSGVVEVTRPDCGLEVVWGVWKGLEMWATEALECYNQNWMSNSSWAQIRLLIGMQRAKVRLRF